MSPTDGGIGHTGGPPPGEAPDPGGWRRLVLAGTPAGLGGPPREVAPRCPARAEALGMTRRACTLEIMARGRYL